MSSTSTDRPMFGVEQIDGNVNARAYHTRMVLTDNVLEIASASENYGERASGIAEFLLNIRGVVQVVVERYKVLVVKAPLFGWDEIEPKIVDLLRFSKVPELLREPDPGLEELWLSDEGDEEEGGSTS